MPQDSLSVGVAERDDIDAVDLGNVGAIYDQIVEVVTSDLLRLDQGLGQAPLIGLVPDRVTGRDLEAIGEFTHACLPVPCLGFDDADNGCTNAAL